MDSIFSLDGILCSKEKLSITVDSTNISFRGFVLEFIGISSTSFAFPHHSL
jgi:hypothetical protein